ncbi:hypothetical protein Q4566_00025 [Tamlana sp. 2_MG-2023]|uniref:hypothetical protein n=1 Tax=unclassified Tamlana TaxID=2614803 RepID=UPI0026E16389|nr:MULTISPECIES: hypothetical protein [unclassified Tamlana]MDO6758567.1 hypothetical protein [Tamlana sp. 2_MG-2023]MDO6789266.1 hypothetical protein [Tamlana sp. 1_MG-2023]
MRSLRHFSLKASSISESVIAMTIIAICLSIAITIYSSVLQTDHNITFYKSQQKVKELLWETKRDRQIENEDYDFEFFKVQKRIEVLDGLSSFKIDFIVITNNSKRKYQYIVSY